LGQPFFSFPQQHFRENFSNMLKNRIGSVFVTLIVLLSVTSAQVCKTNADNSNCKDCTIVTWPCGGSDYYEMTYCNEVVSQTGNNTLGCPVPAGVCSTEDNRISGITLDWDTACANGVPCTSKEFTKFVKKQFRLRDDCEARVGFLSEKCCPEVCNTTDCFCPSSTKPDMGDDYKYTCNDTGTKMSKVEYVEIRAQVVNTYCYADCLCCYTEECCKSDSCRPYRYLGPDETACCDTGCYNGTLPSVSASSDANGINSFLFLFVNI